MRRRLLVLLVAGCVPTVPAICAAQPSAAAQTLFDEARALMDAGNFADACPKLAESQRLDPGGGTLIHLALCYEKQGKTASAWATFNDALSVAKRDRRDDRAKVAEEHLAALTPKLTKLRLIVSADLAKTPGLVIRRGGDPVSRAEWGSAVPVDPGPIPIEASAPGKRPWQRTVSADQPGQTIDAKLGVLPSGDSPASDTSTAPPEEDAGVPTESSKGLRTVGLVVAGVGVVGLGVGGFFGLRAMSKKKDADEHCDGSACRDQAGVDLRHDARSAGTISTIAFVAGGVATAAGVVLYLTAPQPGRARARLMPRLGVGFAGVGAEASW